MFFIFGISTKQKEIDFTQTIICPSCESYGRLELFMTYSFASLFFALINYGFQELNLNKIYAKAFVSNVGSWTVMEKAGMIYEGTLRQEVIKNGIPYDLKTYAILRDDFF